ncbi:unnamed protein product [Closterium sp. Yama58-4]|nr:unnamed protein product [Closterium sp. Yama58-4]
MKHHAHGSPWVAISAKRLGGALAPRGRRQGRQPRRPPAVAVARALALAVGGRAVGVRGDGGGADGRRAAAAGRHCHLAAPPRLHPPPQPPGPTRFPLASPSRIPPVAPPSDHSPSWSSLLSSLASCLLEGPPFPSSPCPLYTALTSQPLPSLHHNSRNSPQCLASQLSAFSSCTRRSLPNGTPRQAGWSIELPHEPHDPAANCSSANPTVVVKASPPAPSASCPPHSHSSHNFHPLVVLLPLCTTLPPATPTPFLPNESVVLGLYSTCHSSFSLCPVNEFLPSCSPHYSPRPIPSCPTFPRLSFLLQTFLPTFPVQTSHALRVASRMPFVLPNVRLVCSPARAACGA